ncbi:MAG: MFS transporter [Parasphingopyxis sp.]|uniref:MFS transporter n=1 Tax=Parasphingopyxis sp. TaxID=1920299 RepID=UPI003FA14710
MESLHDRPECAEWERGADAPCEEAARPFVLAATIMASAIASVTGSIILIALPLIQRDLGASYGALQWISNGYTLFLGALILIGGGAGDRYGRRRVFVIGIAIFTLASIACGFAPTSELLIAGRIVQGIGAALMVPQSLAIIAASFPKEIRGRAIGLWASVSALTTAIGPSLGGVLLDATGWRAAFWIAPPFALAALFLALRYVPESRNEEETGPLDWRGAILAALGFGMLTLGLTSLSDQGATARPLGLIGGGAVLVILFVLSERSARNALMPPKLFANRRFAGANAMTLCLYGALGGVLFLLPFDLIGRRGLSATEVGLTMLPLGVIIGLLSRPMAGLADDHGPRLFLTAGSAIVAAAIVWMSFTAFGYWVGVVGPLVLLAIGMSFVVSPLTTMVMNSAPDSQTGTASGVNNAASRIAGLFAIAIIGAVSATVFAGGGQGLEFGQFPDTGAAAHAAVEARFARAHSVSLLVAASWATLAALLSWFMIGPDPEA